MKFRLFLVIFSIGIFYTPKVSGQQLNQYQHVIIPWEYDFLKKSNQYQLNELTKFLFEKEGFKTIFDNVEKSAEWINDPCKSLTVDVSNHSNMFTTKLMIELRDCHNKVIFKSEEGKSKIKDYKEGYQDALRNAFESVKALGYSYEGTTMTPIEEAKNAVEEAVDQVANEEEVKEVLEEEIIALKVAGVREEIIEVENENVEDAAEAIDEIRDAADDGFEMPQDGELLYAQANELGFQLIDSRPKVVFILLKSNKDDLYFIKDRNGIFYKEGEQWIADFYYHGLLVHKVMKVKW